MIAVLAALALVFFIFRALTWSTTVSDAGVRVKGLAVIDRRIAFADILSVEARRCKPLLEYGGWGFRIGPAGKAYDMRGDEGVQLVLKNGGRVLIGSGRARELAEAIAGRLGARS